MGTIVIGPGGGQGRTIVPDPAELSGMNYTVVFSGPGGTRTEHFGPAGGTVQLVPGSYHIAARAVNADGRLRGLTEQNITISGGTQNILLDSVVGVRNFGELEAALKSIAFPGGAPVYTDATHERNIIVLENNIDMTGIITLAAGKYTLVAEPGKTVTLNRSSSFTGNLITVSGSTELTLGSTAAGLTGNIVFDGNGTVVTTANSLISVAGMLTMNSGVTLTNNTVNVNGGAVTVTAGTFTMSGGTISDNEAKGTTGTSGGGGVYVSGGTFKMSGGTISRNKHTATNRRGGGLYFGNGTEFIMSGGKIINNVLGGTSNSTGGGVYFSGTTFTMTDGEISSNSSGSSGGGVYVGSGTFKMSGGTINSNRADGTTGTTGGGGVYASDAIFTMSGGAISGNTSTNGGGVYIYGTSGVFTMSGGAIYGSGAAPLANTATSGASLYKSSTPVPAWYGDGSTGILSGNTSNETIEGVPDPPGGGFTHTL